MPNRNGKGPSGAGSGTGRGRGLCNRNNQAEMLNQEASQNQVMVEQQRSTISCKGPRGCGTGKERRGNGCGNGRG